MKSLFKQLSLFADPVEEAPLPPEPTPIEHDEAWARQWLVEQFNAGNIEAKTRWPHADDYIQIFTRDPEDRDKFIRLKTLLNGLWLEDREGWWDKAHTERFWIMKLEIDVSLLPPNQPIDPEQFRIKHAGFVRSSYRRKASEMPLSDEQKREWVEEMVRRDVEASLQSALEYEREHPERLQHRVRKIG